MTTGTVQRSTGTVTVVGSEDAPDAIVYLAGPGHETSVAVLLDQARGLLVDARDRGAGLNRLIVSRELYDVLVAAKERERRNGTRPTLLGLFLEPFVGTADPDGSPVAG